MAVDARKRKLSETQSPNPEQIPTLQKFKGTADLAPKKKAKKQNATPKKQEAPTDEKKPNRAKRRRQMLKSKRLSYRRAVGDLKMRLSQNDTSAVSEIEERIEKLEMVPVKSKTALKKIKLFKSLLPQNKKTKNEKLQPTDVKNKQKQKVTKKQGGLEKKNKNVQNNKAKILNPNISVTELDSDEASDTEISIIENESDTSVESEANEEHIDSKTKDTVSNKNKQKGIKKSDGQSPKTSPKKGKTRFVIFVGSLSYDTNDEALQKHFEEVAEVVSVRIPLSKEGKHQGYAFVELKNEESYQRALSLHNSVLDGRHIVCQYTNNSKNKNEVKSKNMKLQQMRKQGLLKGSIKATQKRSVRRAKSKQLKASGGA